MTPSQLALIEQLASGEFISGRTLGETLGVSRAAIWKQLQQLETQGLKVESVKGRGYRLPGGVDLLDRQIIQYELSPQSRACVAALHIEPVIDSTNSWLMRQMPTGDLLPGTVCVAEQQTQGRGRRGRDWVSPFARNLYSSLVWEFEQGVTALEGLSLAVGVAAVNALARLGLEDVKLKWPNDLLWQGRKLGGVLLELSGEASGVCQVVIGIGLNVRMAEADAAAIDQPWVDLAEIAGGCEHLPSRSRLTGVLLDELIAMLCRFQQEGFAPFRAPWEACNAHAGQRVALSTPTTSITGQVLGITEQGCLRLQTEKGEERFLGGEISLRSPT